MKQFKLAAKAPELEKALIEAVEMIEYLMKYEVEKETETEEKIKKLTKWKES